ncbi:MAG: asparagine synthase (glutamine-hydrolyzing) [Candidatus Omnitrophota bacterium]
MCGICGIVNYSHGINEALLRNMCAALKHRGPDDEGIYLSNKGISVGLGHRRLSIIDLSSAGHQPMSNEDNTIWISFNGEIYNYKELKLILEKKGHRFKSATDTETVIHLYEEYGKDCVKHLRGMFAFAIWDEKERSLFLARDRLGKKPLLYSFKDGVFYFASEFSAFFANGAIGKALNAEAVSHYLGLGYIPAPLTIYKDILKLKPANTLVLKNNTLEIHQYWRLDYEKKINISEEEAALEVLRLLEDAVKIRLYSDVPLGAFLSGGIDSAIVVALMSKVSSSRINTFSIGFDEAAYNELKYARKIAQRYHTNHNEFIVRPNAVELLPVIVKHYGEPYADSSSIPTYYVSKLTRQHVTVALNGDGGDEALAGYERYSAVLLAERYQCLPLFLRRLLRSAVGYLPAEEEPKDIIKRAKRFLDGADFAFLKRYFYWVGIFSPEEKDQLLSPEFRSRAPVDTGIFLEKEIGDLSMLNLVDRLLYIDTVTYLPNDLLVKVDIASMSNSLEVRSPFLDHQFIEFAASLPAEYKIRGGIKKFILKKAAKELLPKENIYRKKMGFGVPVSRWLRGEMKDYLKDNLLSRKSLSRGYFYPSRIKELVSGHIDGRFDYGSKLWSLLMLELWHQRFID